MQIFEIDTETQLPFTHHKASANQPTLVFVNSSGATGKVWETGVVSDLKSKGYGTLTIDFRGQGESKFSEKSTFETAEIVNDLEKLINSEVVGPIVLIGLSVGGLRAAHLASNLSQVVGLVLINCLRKKSALTDWLGELETRLISMGGTQLVHDCFRPVTVGTDELGRISPRHLLSTEYVPMESSHPRRMLAEAAAKADWNFPWESLKMPVLILTGMRDRLFRVEDHVDEIMGTMHDVKEVRFAQAGHALHSEEPTRTADEIITFMQGSLTTSKA